MEGSAEQALDFADLFLSLGPDARLRERGEGRLELLKHHGHELLGDGRVLLGGRSDDLVEGLVALHAEGLLRIRTLRRLQQALHDALKVRRERHAHGVLFIVVVRARRREAQERVAHLTRDQGLILQLLDENLEDVVEVARVDHRRLSLPDKLKHASDGPRRGIAHVGLRVVEGVEEGGGGDDRRAVLVVVEDGDVELSLEGALEVGPCILSSVQGASWRHVYRRSSSRRHRPHTSSSCRPRCVWGG